MLNLTQSQFLPNTLWKIQSRSLFSFLHWRGEVTWAGHRWGGLSSHGSWACSGCWGDTQHSCAQPMLPLLCVWDMRPFRWPEPYAWAPIYKMGPIFSDLLLSPISLGLLLSPGAPQCPHASFYSRNSLLYYFEKHSSLLFSPLPDIQLSLLNKFGFEEKWTAPKICFPLCKDLWSKEIANTLTIFLKRRWRGGLGKRNPN